MMKSLVALAVFLCVSAAGADEPAPPEQHLLYVAVPGIGNELTHGGCGILVFDIDHNEKFLRRIPTRAADAPGKPDPMKGICASSITKRLYFGTSKSLTCLDLLSDKILWEKAYPGGCDRMSISPDGKAVYLPSLEGDWWNDVNAEDGQVLNQIITKSGSHNTVFAVDGRHVYLAGLKSQILTIADQPGWITLSIDGQYAFVSTGDVIDTRSKKVIAELEDETGQAVASEKLMEIDFRDGVPIRAGDQFGRGQKR